MVLEEEKLKNLNEFRKEVIRRISDNDDLIKAIDRIDPDISAYLVMLTVVEKNKDLFSIRKINGQWSIVKN